MREERRRVKDVVLPWKKIGQSAAGFLCSASLLYYGTYNLFILTTGILSIVSGYVKATHVSVFFGRSVHPSPCPAIFNFSSGHVKEFLHFEWALAAFIQNCWKADWTADKCAWGLYIFFFTGTSSFLSYYWWQGKKIAVSAVLWFKTGVYWAIIFPNSISTYQTDW